MRILVPPTRMIRADGSYVAISDAVKTAVDLARAGVITRERSDRGICFVASLLESELSHAKFLSPADGRGARHCRPESARRSIALELVGSGVRTLLGFHRRFLHGHQLRLRPRNSSSPQNYDVLVRRLRVSGDVPRPPRADRRRAIRRGILRAAEGVGAAKRKH